MRNVLVTGGAGFIGSSLMRGLLASPGVGRVAALDDLSSGKRENLAEVAERVVLIEGDVRDRALLARACAGVDTVFHLAAVASVPRTIEEPDYCHEVNLEATFRVLRAALEAGARRVVFAASAAAYGNAPGLPKREDMLPDPQSPYAVQKLAGEMYLRTFYDSFGLETVALRFFNVYGPRQDPSSPYSGVLSIFSDCLLERRRPTIFGTGEQSRDFIYVDDIVQALLLAADSPNAPGNVYNCGTGRRVSLREVWQTMQRIEGVDLPAESGPERPGDVQHSEADITRARRDLGFDPKIQLEEGLRRTLDWIRTSKGL
jgi:UDP-glucose 4-epimerase